RDADRLERKRWQGLGRQPRPEAVAVSGHGDEASDPCVSHVVIDLATLHIGTAVVPAAKAGVTCAWPWPRQAGRQVLRVGARVECADGVAPDLPRRVRRAQPAQKPRLLLRAENGLRRLPAAKIRHVAPAVAN